MLTIILDDELKAKLNGVSKHVEIHDASGKPVGRFIPEDEYLRMLSRQAKLAFALREAEAIPYVVDMAEQIASPREDQ